MAYIYILHFNTPLHHAEHYAGCTESIKGRLTAHARGAGSNLCRVLREKGIHWVLGSLSQCSHASMRRIERHLKDQHNAARYCSLCSQMPMRLPETTPYPLEMVPFATDSRSIIGTGEAIVLATSNITVRLTTDHEPPQTILFVKQIMNEDKDALGFIPAGGKEGLGVLERNGLIAIVSNNGEDVGYAAFTFSGNSDKLNIHQCAIRDDARLCGHGRSIVDYLRQRYPSKTLTAKVREDLAANHFWQSMGFQFVRQSTHKTSGAKANHYILLPTTKG